jgi:hypothetical protein
VRPHACRTGCVGAAYPSALALSQWSQALTRGRHIRDRVRGYVLILNRQDQQTLAAERIQLNNVRTQLQVEITLMQAWIDNLDRDTVQASNEEEHRWREMDMVSEARVRLEEANEELGRELTSLRGNALVSLLNHDDYRVRIGVGHAFLCGIAVLAREPVKHHLNTQNRTANTCRAWAGFVNELAHPISHCPGIRLQTLKLWTTSIMWRRLFCVCPSGCLCGRCRGGNHRGNTFSKYGK